MMLQRFSLIHMAFILTANHNKQRCGEIVMFVFSRKHSVRMNAKRFVYETRSEAGCLFIYVLFVPP